MKLSRRAKHARRPLWAGSSRLPVALRTAKVNLVELRSLVLAYNQSLPLASLKLEQAAVLTGIFTRAHPRRIEHGQQDADGSSGSDDTNRGFWDWYRTDLPYYDEFGWSPKADRQRGSVRSRDARIQPGASGSLTMKATPTGEQLRAWIDPPIAVIS